MADLPSIIDGVPDFGLLIARLIEEVYHPSKLERAEKVIKNGVAEGQAVADGVSFKAYTDQLLDNGSFRRTIEKLGGWLAAWFLSEVVEHTFDVDVDNSAFGDLGAAGNRKTVARLITNKMVEGLTGGSTSVEPSQQPAANYLNVVFTQVFESWVTGEIVEILSAVFPKIDKIEHIADLGDKLVNAMGISDSSSRVLRPYIDNLVVEPLRRYIATTYRPALLSESLAVRQFLAGKWTRAQLDQELAVQGWSPDRVEAHILAQQKVFSASDVRTFVDRQYWTHDQGRQHLKDQGYDEQTAGDALRLEGLRRIEQLEASEAGALISAYANGDIDRSQFDRMLTTAVKVPTEQALFSELADVRAAVTVRRLAHGEVRECVKRGIVTTAYYRGWLARERYADEDAFALELLLRAQIDEALSIEEHRRLLEEERRLEKEKRERERLKRLGEIEAERALHRRGSIADLSRGVVRGLIPIARLVEVLTPQYDADTVQIIVDLVEDDRQRYLDDQRRADEARQRAAIRNIDVGALESAVMEHVLSVPEFRGRLDLLRFTPADADILTSTLAARLADADAAKAARDEADKRARVRLIDLGRAELLVRRGVYSLADYDGLLKALDFEDGSRAAMVQLLKLRIEDDSKAAAERKAGEERLKHRGLSLEQFRRAVVLQAKTIDEYQAFLVAEHFTADAQIALLADARDAVAEAEAARKRRQLAEAPPGTRGLPLSTVARAARLGVITPGAYDARLRADGYSADDIAIEHDLLVQEIADVQATRRRRDELEPEGARGLSLAQVEQAVKTGNASIEDYRARAAQLGYAADDVALLVSILEDELAARKAATERHDTITVELQSTRHLSLAQLDDAVRSGLKSIPDYIGDVQALGYAADDAQLLASLLIPAPATGETGGPNG